MCGSRRLERASERAEEIFVRRIIGPKGEDAAGMQMAGERAQSFRLVESGVARVQKMARRMIDIQQHGVEEPARLRRVESFRGSRAGKEVGVQHPTARITGELLAQWHHAAFVPFDYRRQSIHDEKRSDLVMLEGRRRGVAEPQPADHHIP